METDFSAIVIGIFKAAGGHACRIESPDVSAGVPDLSWAWSGEEGFFELKDGDKPELRPSQYRWIKKRLAAGGRASLLWHWDGQVFWIPGFAIDQLKGTTARSRWIKASGGRVPLDELTLSFLMQ